MKNIKIDKKIMYWFMFLIALILYHMAIKPYGGDDLGYMEVLSNSSLGEWLTARYQSWSSRLVLEAIMVFLTQNVLMWKVFNIFTYLLLAYSLYELTDRTSLIMAIIFALSYPIKDMNSAGWIATYMNYLCPLAFGLYSLVPVYKISKNIKPKWWEIFCGFAATMIGANAEQCNVFLLLMLLLFGFKMLVTGNRSKIGVWCIQFIIVLANLGFILTCPGNYVRKDKEVVNWMKDYYLQGFLDKLIAGFDRTMSIMLSSSNVIFMIFATFLFICCLKKTQNRYYRVIAGIPLGMSLLISFGSFNNNSFFSNFISLITSNTLVNAQNWVNLSSYLPLCIYMLIVGCTIMTFFVLFDEWGRTIECIFMYALFGALCIVMGFSPTLYASSKRTLIFGYFILALLVLRIYSCYKEKFSDKEKQYGSSIMKILSVVIFLNNIASA